ncbi:hypothetical protein Btru_074683 [Bulinus truncatus]|nr:hypothetical protein Btru_074683 [Bulinus truncatus]
MPSDHLISICSFPGFDTGCITYFNSEEVVAVALTAAVLELLTGPSDGIVERSVVHHFARSYFGSLNVRQGAGWHKSLGIPDLAIKVASPPILHSGHFGIGVISAIRNRCHSSTEKSDHFDPPWILVCIRFNYAQGKVILKSRNLNLPVSSQRKNLSNLWGNLQLETKQRKEISEVAVQDDGGNPDTATVEPKSGINSGCRCRKLDLFNENIWATAKIRDLEDQLQLTLAKTKREINTLKLTESFNFQLEFSGEEVTNRSGGSVIKTQSAAEKEVDSAINHLEEYISEQEKLERGRKSSQQISGLLSPKDNLTPAHSSGEHSPVPQQQQPAAQLLVQSQNRNFEADATD